MSLRLIVAIILFAAVVWTLPHVVELPWLADTEQQQAQQDYRDRVKRLADNAADEPWQQSTPRPPYPTCDFACDYAAYKYEQDKADYERNCHDHNEYDGYNECEY